MFNQLALQYLAVSMTLAIGVASDPMQAVPRSTTNNLSRKPAMGWNSWNKFGCNISQDTILGAARAISSRGLDKFGYVYVNIDDCWHASARASNGAPQPDPTRFSRGMKAIGDEIHSLGLKFGIYSSAGTLTCAGKFASLGKETIDATTYASWGVDYLKYDNCNNQGQNGSHDKSYQRFKKMYDALKATGRDIIYSICNWGEDQPWEWAAPIGESWRISGDIGDNFDRDASSCPCTSMLNCTYSGYQCSVSKILEYSSQLNQFAGPGHWNDLDMLEVGNGALTYDEYVTHFTMWSLAKSPLILGNDLTNMSNQTFEIITNNAVIAVNQDALGTPVRRVWKRSGNGGGSIQLWAGPLSNGESVIALVNFSPNDVNVSLSLAEAFTSDSDKAKTYEYFDLWAKDSSGKWGASQGTWVASQTRNISAKRHQTKVFRLKPTTSVISSGTSTSTSTSTPSTSTSSGGCTVAMWGQCGGQDYTGCKTCASGSTCTYSNPWYSQCL